METLLSTANQYSNLITAGATAVLAALTAFLWFENRGLRKAGSAPEVVIYLTPNADGSGAVEFVVANVGRGPAFDVKFDFTAEDTDFEAHRVALINDKDRTPFAVIPQDEKITALFGIGFELYGNLGNKQIGPLKPFTVRVEYSDSLGRIRTSQRVVDIRQFAGLKGIISKSNMKKIAESLEGIEKHLARFMHESKRSIAFVDATQISDQYVQKKKGSPGAGLD